VRGRGAPGRARASRLSAFLTPLFCDPARTIGNEQSRSVEETRPGHVDSGSRSAWILSRLEKSVINDRTYRNPSL
jgi:hypothetical protein